MEMKSAADIRKMCQGNERKGNLTTHDIELKIVSRLALATVKWRVVTSYFLPSTMEIVRHNVDKVQVFGHCGNVIGLRSGRLGSGDGSTENQSMFVELGSEFFEQAYKILHVLWFPTALVRVLPIEIKAIEIVFLYKFNDVLDESRTSSRISDDSGVLDGSLVPSTDSDERFRLGAQLAKLVESAKAVLAPIVGQILPRVQNADVTFRADADKGIDQVGAKTRLNVRNVKFATRRPVNGPATKVAYDLL